LLLLYNQPPFVIPAKQSRLYIVCPVVFHLPAPGQGSKHRLDAQALSLIKAAIHLVLLHPKRWRSLRQRTKSDRRM